MESEFENLKPDQILNKKYFELLTNYHCEFETLCARYTLRDPIIENGNLIFTTPKVKCPTTITRVTLYKNTPKVKYIIFKKLNMPCGIGDTFRFKFDIVKILNKSK